MPTPDNTRVPIQRKHLASWPSISFIILGVFVAVIAFISDPTVKVKPGDTVTTGLQHARVESLTVRLTDPSILDRIVTALPDLLLAAAFITSGILLAGISARREARFKRFGYLANKPGGSVIRTLDKFLPSSSFLTITLVGAVVARLGVMYFGEDFGPRVIDTGAGAAYLLGALVLMMLVVTTAKYSEADAWAIEERQAQLDQVV